jgi:peptidyl-prolyl cis-trans isomerase D
LGSSNTVFQEVLSEYYGWSEADFKESLSQQLLQQAVVTRLDTSAQSRAEDVLTQLNKGADFSTLASQVSDDAATKSNAGQYPNAITIDDPDIAPAITNALFQMKPGQISGIINTGFTLDIVKLIDKSAGSVHAAHIQFNLNSITYYTNSLRSKERTHEYIGV